MEAHKIRVFEWNLARLCRSRRSGAQRQKEGRELDRAIRDNELAIARNEARIEAIHERALADVALREVVRIALWAKVPGAVSGSCVNGEAILTAPAGLPDGMTEEDLNAAILAGLGGSKSDE